MNRGISPAHLEVRQTTLTSGACQINLTSVVEAAQLAEVASSSTDPRVGLRAVVALRRLLDQLERLHVDNARASAWSWQEIAEVLGVTRQAAHHKHRSHR